MTGIKADLSGGSEHDVAPRRTYVMGDERCPSCGRRDCDGTCDEQFAIEMSNAHHD